MTVLMLVWPVEERKEVIMATNVDDKIKKLSPARRKKVEAALLS
jgi:hypothetical protein